MASVQEVARPTAVAFSLSLRLLCPLMIFGVPWTNPLAECSASHSGADFGVPFAFLPFTVPLGEVSCR